MSALKIPIESECRTNTNLGTEMTFYKVKGLSYTSYRKKTNIIYIHLEPVNK